MVNRNLHYVAPSTSDWLVRSLWVGPPLSEMEWASLQSFIIHGARVELFTDNLKRIVPKGVTLRDCRELLGVRLPRYGKRAGPRAGSLAMSADVARLECLNSFGGWWVDTDVICLKSFLPIDEGVKFAWEDKGRLTNGVANVAVMRLPPGSATARVLRRRLRYPWLGSPWESPLRRLRNLRWTFPSTLLNPYNVPWGWSAGPAALTAWANYSGLHKDVLSPEFFYPIHPLDWSQLLTMTDSQFHFMSEKSYAVHLWGENFRQNATDRGGAIRRAPWASRYLLDFPSTSV